MHPPPPAELSVVIVCLNDLSNLQDTLASLTAFPEWNPKAYVIDGDSKDGTPAYLANCPYPLAGWVSERDRGIYDAMNKGWNMTPDDSFVLYLGAGDRLLSLPNRESVSLGHQRGTDIVIGTCDMGTWHFHSGWDARLHTGNTAHHQTLMIHKSLWPNSPFDTRFRAYGDWEFNVRLFVMGKKARHYDDFRSFALPGGLSTRHHLGETFRIAVRHGGLAVGMRAFLMAAKGEIKRRIKLRRALADKRRSASKPGKGEGR